MTTQVIISILLALIVIIQSKDEGLSKMADDLNTLREAYPELQSEILEPLSDDLRTQGHNLPRDIDTRAWLEALKVSHEDRYRLIFDANDYRMMRIDELRMSAVAAAEKVARTGRPFHFQPMTSRERRILHLALRGNTDVATTSEGMAPRRHTVISKAQ